MEDKRFDRPVLILTGRVFSVSRQVETAIQAAVYLLDHKWPKGAGEKHQAALSACLALLDGKEGDASVARLAFEEAADEAEILVVG